METENHEPVPLPPPVNKGELLSRIKQEVDAIEQAISPLTEFQLNQPDPGGWSIKDNLAHLNTWNRYLLHSVFQGKPASDVFGIDQDALRQMGDDEINAVMYQKIKDLPYSDVIAALRQSNKQILDTLKTMEFDELLKPHRPDDPQKRPRLNLVVGNTYAHYQEHRLTIQKQIARLK